MWNIIFKLGCRTGNCGLDVVQRVVEMVEYWRKMKVHQIKKLMMFC